MREILVNCTVAAMARQRSYANDHDQARPAITINDHGIRVGAVRERDRHYRDRCYTKTVRTMTDDGDEITKTVRRCR